MKKRVKIPVQDSKALLDLAKKVREKHMADGDASPLKVLDWAEIGPIIEDALATEEKALQLKREKLETYQLRGQRLRKLVSVVRKSRDILTGVYNDDGMKALGRWGFDVVERTQSPPPGEEPSSTDSNL